MENAWLKQWWTGVTRPRGASGQSPSPSVIAGADIADEVSRRIERQVLDGCQRMAQPLEEVLYETLYREQQRLTHATHDPRTEQDRHFVSWLRQRLARAEEAERRSLLQTVVQRYVREICGHFDRRVYRFATSVLPPALGVLLHGIRPSPELFQVDDRILLEGDLEGLKRAAQLGTVVLVPTHLSNLDSLVLGYAIFRLGLPPFAYGAGLNLFSNALTGFFMRNLGAFSVDRTKSDPLYLAAVKEYAEVLLEHGQHFLFFPGGTRSHSGALESQLKLGFLSRVVAAFANRKRTAPNSSPLFVVPCALSYPLVLEAASLIEQYLTKEGGPHFVDVRDEFERPSSWVSFLAGLAELDVQIHVRFGTPLDPMGNAVDAQGRSRDHAGRLLDPARYLLENGAVARDDVRDSEYTKQLASSILASFRRDTVALPSSVLAVAAFACLAHRFPALDLFRLLRVVGPRTSISLTELRDQVDIVLPALRDAALRGEVTLSPELLASSTDYVIERGVATLSAYHREPVLRQRGEKLEVMNPTLLLYYQNRLQGLNLSGTARPSPRKPATWSTP